MEESAFVKVFGGSPIVKLLDFFLSERGLYDYTLTEISENSGVSWTTLHRIFPKLLKLEIVEMTRSIANAKLYRLNEKNHLVQELINTDNKISEYFIQKELKHQAVKLKQPLKL